MRRLLIAFALMLGLGSRGVGSPGPENLLLVVNGDDPASVSVARLYASLRSVPAGNILTLRGVPKGGTIPAVEFRRSILSPILRTIKERGLEGQIECVAYSAGFPYAVDVSADMAGKTLPHYITQPASLTGLTYLYELAMAGNAAYLDMDANGYYRDRTTRAAARPWTDEDRALQTELKTAVAAANAAKDPTETQRQTARAAAAAERLAKRHPALPELLYDLACLRAVTGDAAGAIRALEQAVNAGWFDVTHTEADPDLRSLRQRSDYRELVSRMRSNPVIIQRTIPFHASKRWGIGDTRVLLSAMLGYVGPNANTEAEALACLKRSVAADSSSPKGTVYFMESDDRARTGPRTWAFAPAREALRRLGVRAEIQKGTLPSGRDDVAGAVVGIATFDWASSKSRILPGAFCDHLTSAAGVMTGGGQTLLSEWIRHGAAGSSGTVTEPYNLQAKFPTAFLHVHYASGATLVEAFYQSVAGPYQQLLVGDPLCAPWAPRISVSVEGLKPGAALRASASLAPKATGARAVRFELYVDGRRVASCQPGGELRLEAAGLKRGPHEARVVAVCGPMEHRARAILPFTVR